VHIFATKEIEFRNVLKCRINSNYILDFTRKRTGIVEKVVSGQAKDVALLGWS